jgi:hypothetical protein
MLNNISERFHKWAKGWLVIVLFILDTLFMGYILPASAAITALLSNNSVTPLDLMFFYTPAKAYEIVNKYGDAGRIFYRNVELTADIIYPIIYTLFYSLLISWLFQRAFRPESKMQKYNLVPVGAWLFDLLENAGIVSMLSIFPSQSAVTAWATMIVGTVKWAFAIGSILLSLAGLVIALKNRFKKQE